MQTSSLTPSIVRVLHSTPLSSVVACPSHIKRVTRKLGGYPAQLLASKASRFAGLNEMTRQALAYAYANSSTMDACQGDDKEIFSLTNEEARANRADVGAERTTSSVNDDCQGKRCIFRMSYKNAGGYHNPTALVKLESYDLHSQASCLAYSAKIVKQNAREYFHTIEHHCIAYRATECIARYAMQYADRYCNTHSIAMQYASAFIQQLTIDNESSDTIGKRMTKPK